MTIKEFKIQYAQCQRLTGVRMLGSVLAVFLALGVAALVRNFYGESAGVMVALVIFGFGFPVMLAGFYYADHSFRKFPRMICPHCNRNLYRTKSIVVATGNCPSCGRRVLFDEAIGS